MSIEGKTTTLEGVEEKTEADILTEQCLEEAANLEAQESFIPSLEAQAAKAFYAKDMPDRKFIPAELLEDYRLKAMAYMCFSSLDPSTLEPEQLQDVHEELKCYPTQEVFPWLPYSHATQNYLAKPEDLKRVFEADMIFYYPDRIERKD